MFKRHDKHRKRTRVLAVGLAVLFLLTGAEVRTATAWDSRAKKKTATTRYESPKRTAKMRYRKNNDPFGKIRWRRKWGRDGMGRGFDSLSAFGNTWLMEIWDRIRKIFLAIKEFFVLLFTGKLNRQALDEIHNKYGYGEYEQFRSRWWTEKKSR